jgi:hypothetical protein
MAEWSPQEYVETSKYPASRLAGGIGAAGTSIRDPGVSAHVDAGDTSWLRIRIRFHRLIRVRIDRLTRNV